MNYGAKTMKGGKPKITRAKMLMVLGIVLLVSVVGIVSYFGVQYYTTLQTGVTTVTADEYEIEAYDYLDDELDDELTVVITWLKFDTSNVETEEYVETIEDLEYADMTADGSGASHDIEEDEVYVMKVAIAGFDDQWLTNEPLIGEGLMGFLTPGLNLIFMMNSTADVGLAAISENGMGVVVNQTNDREWTIFTQTLDDVEGTGEATNKEGFLPYYDFENAIYQPFVIRLTFNDTADLSWCVFKSSYDADESISTVYLLYDISAVIRGADEFAVKLGSGLGTDFELEGIEIGYLDTAGTFTAWDIQN